MADKGDFDEPSISDDSVLQKYKVAAQIVNKILLLLIEKCQVGATAVSICEAGDELITKETEIYFRRDKKLKKGIAFPTCVSVNNCICHYSPLKSEPDTVLAEGDVVKLDLGAHIDGFIAVIAHTIVVGASKTNKITGKKAEVIRAAYYAAEAALRLVVPGGENNAVTNTIQKIAECYKCKPVEGMLSHQLKQFRIDGEKSIIQNPTEAQKKEHEKCEFSLYEVYAVDVLISSGEGKGKEKDARTTVYKKTDEVYHLKMKTSKEFLSKVDRQFGTMPFTIRSFEDEKRARMGVVECFKHKLVEPFTVLFEKEGEYVAQFKFTVLLLPTGPCKITSGPMDLNIYQTNMKIDDDSIKELLNTSTKVAKKKKKEAGAKEAPTEDKKVDNQKPVKEAPTEDGKVDNQKPVKEAPTEDGKVDNQKPVKEVATVNKKVDNQKPVKEAATVNEKAAVNDVANKD